MKVIRFFFLLGLSIFLGYSLNRPWGKVPALGHFLNPFEGFWQNATPRNTGLKSPKTIKSKDLRQSVDIALDSSHIPHIFAQSDWDLYYMQGYMTAKDRLWQMDFQTMAAAGRLSEILGKDSLILQFDRGQRRKGMLYAAEKARDAFMSVETSANMLKAYAAGVNAYIDQLNKKDLPIEYKLIGYRPEAWSPLKSALLLKYMAESLSSSNADLENTNALAWLGKKNFDLLYPLMEKGQIPIVNKTNQWKQSTNLQEAEIPFSYINMPLDEGPNPLNGSNNWAVNGNKSETAYPILCNDPHLGLNLPSLWYMIQLQSPDINVIGASLPGAPGIIIGMNDHISWGVTNAQRDLVDWYRITFLDDQQHQYLLDGKATPVENRLEVIKIRDEEDFVDTVKYTAFGPVYYDRHYRAEEARSGYAYRWIAHDPSNEVLAFYKINRAKNYEAFKTALSYYQAPAQNFVFASVDNEIAMHVHGKFPARTNHNGRFLQEGNSLENGWKTYIPFEENVFEYQPERNFVFSANQHPADSTYPYFITAKKYEYYRNRRIFQLLEEKEKWSVSEMMQMQNDNFNLQAAESLPFWLNQINTEGLPHFHQKAFLALKNWDFHNEAYEKAPTFYAAWWKELYRLLYDEWDQKGLPLLKPSHYTTIKILKENPDFYFFDLLSTPEKEDAPAIIQLAFKNAMHKLMQEEISGKKLEWAAYKGTYLQHLTRIKAFNIAAPVAGNAGSINAATQRHGPSWRMITALHPEGNKMWGIYPGGPSGNPASPYYQNQVEEWVNGQYREIPFFKNFNATSNYEIQHIQAKVK
ncbi:penicillin acylase family protein [Persicobacter diffluens]|uniref:Beta-lactam antibiotic acylase n=1 Tax=Persicobacter diffluens TaxID=981 RepID=A0AAN4VXM1_9BACT|nr:beta-lactam antibiotic acylase [Persicobacter diffluens]